MMAAALSSVLLVALVVSPGLVPAAAGAAPPMVRVAGTAPTLPTGAQITGPTGASTSITADLALKPRDPAALDAFVAAVSTPGSPNYHHYLGDGQFAAQFGPTTATIAAARAWLSSNGLQVGTASSDGLLIPVTGSVAQMEQAFDVSIVNTRLSGGRIARFADVPPAVPASLSASIEGVIGLSTVSQAAPQIVPGPTGGATASTPKTAESSVTTQCQAAAATGGYTADELAAAYGFTSLYGRTPSLTGAGETIGIYELESYANSDVTAYKTCYGLTNTITNVPVGTGGGTGPGSGEAALDIEDAIGLAPGAAIKVYEGPNNGNGPIDTYEAMVADRSLKVISTSWGACEPEMDPGQQATESTLFAEAASQGQTVVAASGDSGSTDCYLPSQPSSSTQVTVDDPADQPDVTGVGGTSLLSAASTTETSWNDNYGATGGGVSSDFAQPSWQLGPGVDSTAATAQCAALGRTSCREVPDVAASADPVHGYAVYFSGRWQVFGGTSAASPLWAALIAVADQGLTTPAGFLNPTLYGAGACVLSPFNDVTTGTNAALGTAAGRYPATANYDLVTGWGTPMAARLLSNLATSPRCPVVTGVSPAKSSVAGGNSVTISGSSLNGATSVSFGSVSSPSFQVTSPTSIVAQVPPGPSAGGAVDVTVTNASGTSRSWTPDHYTYAVPGYWLVASDGGIFAFGQAGFHGSTGAITLNQPVVGMASTFDDGGYWLVASDGGIFAFGDAAFYGSTGAIHLNQPIVGMAATPDGGGYWLVASDGGIFAFGDAAFYGSTGAMHLNKPIVGMAKSLSGHGYWLVASDGGIFAFGDAAFYGSTGAMHLNKPIVGMAASLSGHGYWLVASDGGIFAFGDAAFYGSTGNLSLARPIVGMAST
jgi:subtilase family serine protease